MRQWRTTINEILSHPRMVINPPDGHGNYATSSRHGNRPLWTRLDDRSGGMRSSRGCRGSGEPRR